MIGTFPSYPLYHTSTPLVWKVKKHWFSGYSWAQETVCKSTHIYAIFCRENNAYSKNAQSPKDQELLIRKYMLETSWEMCYFQIKWQEEWIFHRRQTGQFHRPKSIEMGLRMKWRVLGTKTVAEHHARKSRSPAEAARASWKHTTKGTTWSKNQTAWAQVPPLPLSVTLTKLLKSIFLYKRMTSPTSDVVMNLKWDNEWETLSAAPGTQKCSAAITGMMTTITATRPL